MKNPFKNIGYLKPEKCCNVGTYEHTIPLNVRNKVVYVDFCIVDIVVACNAAGLSTIASCCGHGIQNGSVLLEDGREILVRMFVEGKDANRRNKN